jgi:hypothetical protein
MVIEQVSSYAENLLSELLSIIKSCFKIKNGACADDSRMPNSLRYACVSRSVGRCVCLVMASATRQHTVAEVDVRVIFHTECKFSSFKRAR